MSVMHWHWRFHFKSLCCFFHSFDFKLIKGIKTILEQSFGEQKNCGKFTPMSWMLNIQVFKYQMIFGHFHSSWILILKIVYKCTFSFCKQNKQNCVLNWRCPIKFVDLIKMQNQNKEKIEKQKFIHKLAYKIVIQQKKKKKKLSIKMDLVFCNL